MIVLTTNYLEGGTARAIPGAYYDPEYKGYILPNPTPKSAMVALRVFPTLVVEYPELAELRDQLVAEVRPFDNADKFKIQIVGSTPEVEAQLATLGFDYYDFQNFDLGYASAMLEKLGGVYIGWERGLGKTLGGAALIESCGADRALVVCPNTAKLSVWRDELAKWLPSYEIIPIRNARAQREKDLGYTNQLTRAGKKFVLIVHYESLNIIAGDSGRGWDKYGKWDIVIADEAHRIWNPKTRMTRALKRIKTERKVAMSGSIIANHAEELFSPLQWLFPKNYSSKWRDWNYRYLDYAEGNFGKICLGVKPEKLEELRNELGVFMVYRRKEDELDLPPRTEETLKVDLSDAQRKVYNDLIEQRIAELPDGNLIKAETQLTLLTRLRQVATGLSLVSANGDTSGLSSFADSSKMDLALDIIKDNDDEAFVVFTWYKASAYEMERRLERMGITSFVVTGDTNQNARADYIRRFQAGEGRVFIGTLATLGESVTLHRANNAIFLDRSWNPSANDQAADRIYRIGQSRPVTITHIVARDTVDEFRVQPVIDDKAALRRLILGA